MATNAPPLSLSKHQVWSSLFFFFVVPYLYWNLFEFDSKNQTGIKRSLAKMITYPYSDLIFLIKNEWILINHLPQHLLECGPHYDSSNFGIFVSIFLIFSNLDSHCIICSTKILKTKKKSLCPFCYAWSNGS